MNMRTKIVAVLLCFMASAQMMLGQVTLKMQNVPLRTVIEKIQSQTKNRFFYDDQVGQTPIAAVDVKNVSLTRALDETLKGTGIIYTKEDNVIYLKKEGLSPTLAPEGEKRKLTGQIVDETGEPMIGVTVAVKGTKDLAVTDFDGNYTVFTDQSSPVLVFSYLGYKNKEVAVHGQAPVNVSMDVDAQAIDEVVVTALGIKREKKMLGYAVQDIKSDALNVTGDPSVTSALSGKVAGLQMNTASTGLGGSTKITIRGNSSLTDNNQPLWVVDGVPFTDNNTSSASTYGGIDRGGTSFDINPEDIESISVLKGANAAAL